MFLSFYHVSCDSQAFLKVQRGTSDKTTASVYFIFKKEKEKQKKKKKTPNECVSACELSHFPWVLNTKCAAADIKRVPAFCFFFCFLGLFLDSFLILHLFVLVILHCFPSSRGFSHPAGKKKLKTWLQRKSELFCKPSANASGRMKDDCQYDLCIFFLKIF